ncbi:hypothetical protein B0H13DRAFT_1862187 [Mycena leptocephala]|nr:hypothetical protein B0H13DRAFT_1862187 [Mycena leptocephala]
MQKSPIARHRPVRPCVPSSAPSATATYVGSLYRMVATAHPATYPRLAGACPRQRRRAGLRVVCSGPSYTLRVPVCLSPKTSGVGSARLVRLVGRRLYRLGLGQRRLHKKAPQWWLEPVPDVQRPPSRLLESSARMVFISSSCPQVDPFKPLSPLPEGLTVEVSCSNNYQILAMTTEGNSAVVFSAQLCGPRQRRRKNFNLVAGIASGTSFKVSWSGSAGGNTGAAVVLVDAILLESP